jgi:hypothetical protein
MIAMFTLLVAFPLGFFVRSRVVATLTYAIAYLWAFTFQTLYLLLDMLEPDGDTAFEAGGFPMAYGLVTATVLVVGLGLVQVGHLLAGRRRGGVVGRRELSA